MFSLLKVVERSLKNKYISVTPEVIPTPGAYPHPPNRNPVINLRCFELFYFTHYMCQNKVTQLSIYNTKITLRKGTVCRPWMVEELG